MYLSNHLHQQEILDLLLSTSEDNDGELSNLPN